VGVQNEGMTRYRPRAVLLLFLLLHLTACHTWQPVATPSPSQFIEAEQPDRVRVTTEDVTELELENPLVEGDELVAPGVSMPLADILLLEVREFSMDRTVLLAVGVAAGVLVAAVAVVAAVCRSSAGAGVC
jgi:hypothetical protein